MSVHSRFLLLGHPVAHSVSPAIHRAAYAALGRDCDYALADCPDEASVIAAVDRLRRGEISGANVTVPWKRVAFQCADRVDVSARDTGVANVLSLEADGAVVAANTDASALRDEIADERPDVRSIVVIGAGGAARAAVVAGRALGASSITVTSRGFCLATLESDEPPVRAFRSLGAETLAWPRGDASGRGPFDVGEPLLERLRGADVLVQATSCGMHGGGPGQAVSNWVPWSELDRGALAYDVVYVPPQTPFLDAARAAGLQARGGLGMLVRQAALAVEMWLGEKPPLAPLRAAAESALGLAAAP